MRTLLIGAAALLIAGCGGKVEIKQDSTAIKALAAESAAAPGVSAVDTAARRAAATRTLDRPARIDHMTEQQKALQDKRLKRP